MKTKLLILLGWLACAVTVIAQTTSQPIQMGKLTSDLDANTQDIVRAQSLTFGPTTLSAGLLSSPAARIHILPNGTPTTAADGIWWGSDVKLYRSAAVAPTLHLVGNLDISGTITANGQDPILPGSDVDWTGTHTWAGSSSFGGVVAINNTTGITFPGVGAAAATRTALALVPGTNIQAWDADLDELALLSHTANYFIVGDGSDWTAKSPADARTALQLAAANSPTFTNLTLSGTLTVTGATSLSTLAASGAITLGGDANLYRSAADTLKTDDALIVVGNLTFPTAAVSGTMTFGGDATLYRSAADKLKTDDTFIANYLTPTHPLEVAYGGFGIALDGVDANKLFYTNGSGLAQTDITSYGRDLVGQTSVANMRTYLGLGTLATQSGTFSGTSSGTNTGDQTITLSGDASGSGTGAITTTLATVNSSVGQFGSATAIPRVTVNAKGLVTAIDTVPATPVIPDGSVDIATKTTGAYIMTITAAAGNNLKFTGSSPASGAHSAAIVIDTAQDIKTSDSPTFAGLNITGVTTLANATASTASNNGALVLTSGGLGVGGAVNVGTTLGVTGATTLASTLSVAGAMTTSSSLIQTTNAALGFATGRQGSNYPVFSTVNSVSNQITGIQITGRANGAGVDLDATGSGNENLRITALGTGSTVISSSGTGAISLAENTTVTGTLSVSSTLGVTGTTTLSALLHQTLVEANTAGVGAPNILLASESGTVLTNSGATALNYETLPSAAAGLVFTFICVDADGMRISADTGDDIRLREGTLVSTTGGNVSTTTIGASLTLYAVDSTHWVALPTTAIGLWSIDSVATGVGAYGSYYFSSSASTSLGTATPAKASGTTTAGNVDGFTHTASNRLTYDGKLTQKFQVTFDGALVKSAHTTATTATIWLAKGGSTITGASTLVTMSGDATTKTSVSLVSNVELATSEYIEVWIESSSVDDLTVAYGNVSVVPAQ